MPASDPEHPAERSSAVIMAALCLATSLSVIHALAIAPFLADMGADLDASVALIGQAVTASALFGAVIGLGIGAAADAIGYKRLLMLGIVGLAVYDIGIAIVPNLPLLIVIQLLGGLSAAVVSPIAAAIVGTRYEGDARRSAISRLYAAASLAGIVGFPLLTFIGDRTIWRWSFVTLAIFSLLTVALTWWAVPRDSAARPPRERVSVRSILASYGPLVRQRALVLVYLAQYLRGVAWTGMLTYVAAFFIEDLGLSLQQAGLAWLVIGPGFLIGSLLVSGPLRRFVPRHLFMASVALMGAFVGLIFLGIAGSLTAFGLLFLAAVAGGVAEVVLVTLMAAETPVSQGTAMAFNSSIVRMGTASGAIVGGALLALGNYQALAIGFPLITVGAVWVGWHSQRAAARAMLSLEPVRH
jgi:predicted MFS family arabinose efflux permease